ncbi:hypothetical protein Q5P01_015100 [Channa striata]|uniref:Uncharacterized protein n=1 Tax=Channa striata TaxID=64152 RepID=A0AA88MJI2_CHASR|nr:hypothetical protein Q5P01_015100 [Channa striata]
MRAARGRRAELRYSDRQAAAHGSNTWQKLHVRHKSSCKRRRIVETRPETDGQTDRRRGAARVPPLWCPVSLVKDRADSLSHTKLWNAPCSHHH